MATAILQPAVESSLSVSSNSPDGATPTAAPQLVTTSPLSDKASVRDIASSYSIFALDTELDTLIDEMQEEIDSNGQASDASMARFKLFCDAHNTKVDRIAGFLKLQETVVTHARAEANRFADRARTADNKAKQIKNMMLWYLAVRDVRKIDGNQFSISRRANSQDSVKIVDETNIPLNCRTVTARFNASVWAEIEKALPVELRERLTDAVQSTAVDTEAVKTAYQAGTRFAGVTIERGSHIRVT